MNEMIKLNSDSYYLSKGDLITIKQHSETKGSNSIFLNIDDIHVLAQHMGISKIIKENYLGDDVSDDLRELFWLLEKHIYCIRTESNIDLFHLSAAMNAYNKHVEICHSMHLVPKLWSRFERFGKEHNDLPF